MCIAILNNGNELTRDELANCWISNDDGAGMLFIENNKLVACKYPNADGYGKAGESFNEFYAEYREIYKRSVDNNTPVLLHFRIATHGFDPAYLHPFFISDNVGMIHNGIIDGYGSKDVSDTAEFSQELATLPSTMLGDVSFLEIPFVYNMIYLAIGTYNKLVFMDDKGQWTIFNEDKGHWVGDNWFSNDSYKSLTRYHGNVAKGGVYDAFDDEDDEWWIKYNAEPFIKDKSYHCDLCDEQTLVDWDACCVNCGQYITESENDVINKAVEEGENFII
jgi:hypothetical protein